MNDMLSLSDAQAALRCGTIRPTDLVEACLARIRSLDRDVRAWVSVDEVNVSREAELLTAEAAAGTFRGPLHGIPIGVKDIIDVAGVPTGAGSPLRKDCVADADAPVVAALRRAGAIILGKTVTVEFACFDPSPTRNPWDPDLQRSPGGSSSGSAAALAVGMCCGALGTQTGGSLVRPSSYCGVATCKPTFGRVDRAGVVPVSYHFDHVGPMARKVGDLAILLECLPPSSDFAPPQPAQPRPAHDRLRLGLVESFFLTEAAPRVRSVVEEAVRRLAPEADIETVAPTVDFEAIQDVHTTIMAAEAAAYHRRDFAAHREAYGPKITDLLDRGLAATALEMAEALAHLHDYRRRVSGMLDGVDALVMPATDTTAPGLETTGPKRFQCPWSCAGLPVVSLPCGLADDGMPVAIQLVGRYHDEEQLLRIGAWCEERFAFIQRPPSLRTDAC